MIDIGQAILELEALNRDFDVPLYEIGVAIKMLKMWRHLKRQASKWEMGLATHLRVHTVMEKAEKEFFPTKMRQTVTIEIERKSESLLEDTIDQVRLVPGVKDVRPHDSRY